MLTLFVLTENMKGEEQQIEKVIRGTGPGEDDAYSKPF